MHVKRLASPRLFLTSAICAAMCLLVAPWPARAENLTFVGSADQQHLAPSPPQTSPSQQSRLVLNDDGNVMVRFNRMSVTFIHDTNGTSQQNWTRPNAPRQDVASIGSISVKFGVVF